MGHETTPNYLHNEKMYKHSKILQKGKERGDFFGEVSDDDLLKYRRTRTTPPNCLYEQNDDKNHNIPKKVVHIRGRGDRGPHRCLDAQRNRFFDSQRL